MPPALTDDAGLVDGRTRKPKADPTREYVSGNGYAWRDDYIRSLPLWIDDITRDFGDDVYERMLLDPEVQCSNAVLKLGILSDGYSVSAAVKKGEADYDRAEEIAAFCRRNLGDLKGFVTETLWDMLDAMAFGNRVAELVYEYRRDGEDSGKLCLKAIKPKPRRSIAFLVDPFLNIVGLLGLVPGVGLSVLQTALIGDPAKVPNLLPRRKFAILTHRPRNGDPRGTSIDRAAYHPWWFKGQNWGEWLKYAAQFAGPSLWGTTAEGASATVEMDGLGNVVPDDDGNPVIVSPEDALLAAMQGIRNGTAAAFPYGTLLNALQMQGEGAPFVTILDTCNREIRKAILCNELATSEGRHQARAASQQHADVQDEVESFGKGSVEEMVKRDILAPLVEYNYGPEAHALVPTFQLADTQAEDLASVLTAFAAVGYQTDHSQWPEMDAKAGLPKRSPESLEHADEMRQAQLQSAQGAAKAAGRKPKGAGFSADYVTGAAGFGLAASSSDKPTRWITLPGGRHIPITEGGGRGKGGAGGQSGAAAGGGAVGWKLTEASATVDADPQTRTAANQFFGRVVSDKDLQELLGAPAGAQIMMDESGGNLIFHVQHDLYQQMHLSYAVQIPGTTRKFMQLELYHLKDAAPAGMGTRAWDQMVNKGREMGMEAIHIPTAARTSEMVGYYVWPRFGADGPIPEDKQKALPFPLSSARTLSDLMGSKEGKEWWKANGKTVTCTFKLAADSSSSQAWERYREERG